ncbi:hypothetical protein, partial [Endozoicomonas sp. ONNA2]|uniref:hypothetical protein n=1 Tax=Endozoicomonas sp. ONNA2 TaxID=2828741 RepID=UPI002147248D
MESMSSSHTQIRLNSGDGAMCSDKQPLMVTPTRDQALTDAAATRDGNGKSIVYREVRAVEASEQSHGVSTHALLQPSQSETAQVTPCEGASQDIKAKSAEQAEKKSVLDPEMLTRQLDEIETQIIELTAVHGEIPQKELMRFKLAALYIQENILTRMLYGMASQEEAFSKFQSLGDLIPQSSNGTALMRVLDLWWLPSNEKYFPEKTVNSLKKLHSVSEYLQTALGHLNTAAESFDKGRLLLEDELEKELIPSEGSSDSSTASSFTSEFYNEKEFKDILARLGSILQTGSNESSAASQNGSQVYSSASSDNPYRDKFEAVTSRFIKGKLVEQPSEAMKSDFSLTKLDKLVVIFHHLYQIHNND